jgi:hypothetical protein
MTDDHVFIFGGPRNGSWHYQYARCQSDPVLYSGLEDLDWDTDNKREYPHTTAYSTVFRKGKDPLYQSMEFIADTGVFNLFESACLQPPEIFMDNADMIESQGRRLIAKCYPHSYGLCDILEHQKVYIRRPLASQWRSFALANMSQRWQWEEGDIVPDQVSTDNINKEQITKSFIEKMTSVYMFYQQNHQDSNFTTISFEDVMSMDCNSPLLPSPKFNLTEEAEEYLEDLTPFKTSFLSIEEDEQNKMTLMELEEKTFQ